MRAPGRAWETATFALQSGRAKRRAAAAVVLSLAVLLAGAAGEQRGTPKPAAAARDTSIAPVLAAYDDTADLIRLRREQQRATREAARRAAMAAERAVAAPKTSVVPRPAPPAQRPAPAVTAAAAGRAAVVIAFALAQVGKPYVFGSGGPYAYDCSGLVMAAFARVGIRLPHQSEGIAGRGVFVPRGQWQPADVLWYPGHVGIYLGGGRMVDAENPSAGIRVSTVWGSPSARRLL